MQTLATTLSPSSGLFWLLWLLICPTIGGLIGSAKSRDRLTATFAGRLDQYVSRKSYRIGRIANGVILGLVGGPLGWIAVLCQAQGGPKCPACLKPVPAYATKCCHCANTLPGGTHDYAWQSFAVRCPYCAHGTLVYTSTGRDNFAFVDDAAKCEGCGSTGVVIKRGRRVDIRWNNKEATDRSGELGSDESNGNMNFWKKFWKKLMSPTDFLDAVKTGNLEKVKALLQADPYLVCFKGKNRWSALHLAAANDRMAVLEWLLISKADLNARDKMGCTPLFLAVIMYHEAVTEFLLAKGADVNAKSNVGLAPLHHSAGKGRQSMVELLLANNAEVNARDKNGLTPLHYAAENGHATVAKLLLANGAEVDAKNNNNCTPLITAIYHGRKDVVELLIAKGADLNGNGTGDGGWVALTVAAFQGDTELVELLIANGADVNAKDGHGRKTVLHGAACAGQKQVVELLLAKGADVHATDNHGRTPLALALQEGKADVAELLREHGGHE